MVREKMIPFNKPLVLGYEAACIQEALNSSKLSGDGFFTKRCHEWLESNLGCKKALLTTSATHALEMSAILCDIQPGDEVIMPSFTFVSTANAFVLRGAKIVFIDIDPNTMNMDGSQIEGAITDKTKAIVVVHYGGVACDMDKIMQIANKHNLFVVEDAAQAIMSKYKEKHLGTIGHFGCFSFHETKNITCGEGGALLINDERFIERAEIIREKGTNRSKFWRGEIDKYTWVDIGSSYLPSELNAAYLYAQLEHANEITRKRVATCKLYYQQLFNLEKNGLLQLQKQSDNIDSNGHLFYIKLKDVEDRTKIINYLSQKNVRTVFHYVPLHSSPYGLKCGIFNGKDVFTTKESERLLRLPCFFDLSHEQVIYISDCIKCFFIETGGC